MSTAWKVPKYGAISGQVFSPNTGKYRPEITPYLDTFHAVCSQLSLLEAKLANSFRYYPWSENLVGLLRIK